MSQAQRENNRALSWTVEKRGDVTVVVFDGSVDETANFEALEGLQGKVTFDLERVDQLNSEGVRRWIFFLKKLSALSELVFERCSIPVVLQLNMVKGFQGQAEVRSFYAPYYCEETGAEEQRLLAVEDVEDPDDPPVFPSDDGIFELDELPERYFAFIAEGRR